MAFEDYLTSLLASDFLQQPIDQIMLSLLIWFGWIPIAITLAYGFALLFKDSRQGQYSAKRRWVIVAISVPAMTEQSPKALENLFANLYGANSSVSWKEKWIIGKFPTLFSFEIASTEGYISFYVRCETRYRDLIEAGVYAHYADAEIYEVDDYAHIGPDKFPDDEWDLWGSELKLKKPDIFPIRTYVDFEDKMTGEIKDPLGQILELLSKMNQGEHFWIQLLVQPNGNDWNKKGEAHIASIFGKSDKPKVGAVESGLRALLAFPGAVTEQAFDVNISEAFLGGAAESSPEDDFKALKLTHIEREQADGVLMKISKQSFDCKMRIVYMGRKSAFKKGARTAFVKGMYNQFSHMNLNSFGMHGGATPQDDYFWQEWALPGRQGKLLRAYRGRSWGIGADPYRLNIEELASLWHFPAIGIKAPLITKSESRRGEPPVSLPISPDGDILPSGPVQFPGEVAMDLPTVSNDDALGLPGLAVMETAPVAPTVHAAPSIDGGLGLPRPRPPVELSLQSSEAPVAFQETQVPEIPMQPIEPVVPVDFVPPVVPAPQVPLVSNDSSSSNDDAPPNLPF